MFGVTKDLIMLPISSNTVIEFMQREGDFVQIMKPDIIELIIDGYTKRTGTRPQNRPCMRINSIVEVSKDHVVINWSSVGFFDFLTTNMLTQTFNDSPDDPAQIINHVEDKAKFIMSYSTLIQILNNTDKIKNYRDAFTNKNLANIASVSILIEDSEGVLGITQRTDRVAIGRNIYSSTVSGTIDSEDMSSSNPILACALRECKEELNISDIELKITGAVISLYKLQPVFLIQGVTSKTWKELSLDFRTASDFNLEVSRIGQLKREDYKEFIKTKPLTPAAKYQIETFFKENASIIQRKGLKLNRR